MVAEAGCQIHATQDSGTPLGLCRVEGTFRPCSIWLSGSRPYVWSVGSCGKGGSPYLTRAKSPGPTVNTRNPLLAPGDPGIQTASLAVLVTLATHLSLERWPVQTRLQKQASGVGRRVCTHPIRSWPWLSSYGAANLLSSWGQDS